MWAVENRPRYDRSGLRHPSGLTGAEWALAEPLIPPAKRRGNKRTVDLREVVNGLMHLLGTGCQWAALPKDLAPRSTVHDYLCRWEWDGTLGRIHHALYVQCREQVQRKASPTAGIVEPRGSPDIDSESVKGAEKGGPALIRPSMMRARRSRARSATCLWTPRAC